MAKKKQGRVAATRRDTRRPLEAAPVDAALVEQSRASLLDRVARGELDFRAVFDVRSGEDTEANRLYQIEQAWLKRRRDDPPERSGASVPMVASGLRVRQVLDAHDSLRATHVEMILDEYDFDGDWTLGEIGSAEADVLTSAVRLVTRASR